VSTMVDYSNFETELLQKMLVKTQCTYNTYAIKLRNKPRNTEAKPSTWTKIFKLATVRAAITAELVSRGVTP